MENSLSDEIIIVDTDALKNLSSVWRQNISSLDLDNLNLISKFKFLIDEGIGTSYFKSLEKSITNLKLSGENYAKYIVDMADNQGRIDNYNSDGYSYAGGKDLTYDTSNIEIKSKDIQAFDKKITNNDFNTLLKILVKYNDSKSFEYLKNELYANDLKNILLSSNNINNQLKEKIKYMDPKTIQKELLSKLREEEIVSELGKIVIYNYLIRLSKNNKVDHESVNNFYKNIDKVLVSFDKILEDQNINNNLLVHYENNDMDDDVSNIIKFLIDNKTSNAKDYLSSTNKEELYSAVSDVKKTLEFYKTKGIIMGRK